MFLNLQTFGIDISDHDDPIDWDKLVSDINPRFVFARAYHMSDTPEQGYPDPSFPAYWQRLGDKHLPRGAYLFCNPKADPDYAIEKCFFSVYTPNKGDLLPVLDIEDNYDSDSHVPVDKRVAQIARMVELTSHKIGGQKPIIYTKKRIWDELGNPSQFSGCPLWVLNYGTVPSPQNIPSTWTRFAFWQYAENIKSEKIFGKKGDYDVNFFNDIEDKLSAFKIQ